MNPSTCSFRRRDPATHPTTHLRYAVEMQIPRTVPGLGLAEPLLEACVYKDLPANLAALRVACEALRVQRHARQSEAEGTLCRGSGRAGICRSLIMWSRHGSVSMHES